MAKKQKHIEKREEKARKIATGIASKEKGDFLTITPFAKEIGIHPHTLVDALDQYDSLKEIGFQTVRDNKGKLKGILITDDNIDTLKGLKKQLDEIKKTIEKLKK